MAEVIAGMTMSLDGFVADRDGSAGRLYPDFDELADSDVMRSTIDETGAVLMGRRTFEMAGDTDSYADTYELQVPIFVLTHRPPEAMPKQNDRLTFTFVTGDVASAVAQAKAAAADRDVTVVGGADVILQLLQAGLVDVLSIDVMPVFLGEGLRLFDDPVLEGIGIEPIAVDRVGQRITTRFRVLNDT